MSIQISKKFRSFFAVSECVVIRSQARGFGICAMDRYSDSALFNEKSSLSRYFDTA